LDKKEEKFLSLIEIHKRIIYKVANGYCKEVDEREDLIQEIIIQLWLSLDNYSDQYKLSTWVYRIALNTSISHYRKNKTRKARTTILSPVIELKNDDCQSRFESEDFQLLNKLIQELKEIDKGIFLLYLDGFKYKEIAEIMAISPSNVSSKISRIKKALKLEFKKNKYSNYG